jgi:hypothetical protein
MTVEEKQVFADKIRTEQGNTPAPTIKQAPTSFTPIDTQTGAPQVNTPIKDTTQNAPVVNKSM